MLEVEPVAPFEPRLMALVRPVVVAPEPMFNVVADVVPNSVKEVAPAPRVSVVAAPNALMVVEVVLKTSNEAPPVTLVTKAGEV